MIQDPHNPQENTELERAQVIKELHAKHHDENAKQFQTTQTTPRFLGVLLSVLVVALIGQQFLMTKTEDLLSKNNGNVPEAISVKSSGQAPVAAPSDLRDDTETQALRKELQDIKAAQSAMFSQMNDELKSFGKMAEALQEKVQSASQETLQDREQIRASLFGILALTHLESRLARGEPFIMDLQAIRAVAPDDAVLQSKLQVLEPFAKTGLISYDVLRQNFQETARQAELSLRKQEAQTWLDRIKLALSGFITIRSLQESEDEKSSHLGRYEAIYTAMHNEDRTSVLDLFDALNETARQPLLSWREKYKAHLEVDQALDVLAAKLSQNKLCSGSADATCGQRTQVP